MYINIEKNSDLPAYKQIYNAIRSKITDGAYKYGAKLPSKRNIAEMCGVSITTAEHAYALLCDEGYCEMRRSSGCYVTYSAETGLMAGLPYIKEEKGKTDSGEDFHYENIPFSAFSKKIRKVLLDRGENILRRSPNNGCAELREAIRDYLLRSRNIVVSPEQIVIGSGAEYLYGICIQILGRNRVIALEDPSYEKIKAVYEANDAVCEMLPMCSDGIESKALDSTKASILHVTPFKSFPSGITASAEKREEYISWAKKRNAFIIEDDYASEFTLTGNAPETLFSLCRDENVIYINTFSKTIAPSIRAGYMLLPPHLIPVYEEKAGFYSCTVPMLEQYFLAEWIESGDFERNINRIRHKGTSKN